MILAALALSCADGVQPTCRGLSAYPCMGPECVTVECEGRAEEHYDSYPPSSCELGESSRMVLRVHPEVLNLAAQSCSGIWYEHWFPEECMGLEAGQAQVLIHCGPAEYL